MGMRRSKLYLLLALNFFPNSQAQASRVEPGRVVSLTLFLPRMDRTWKLSMNVNVNVNMGKRKEAQSVTASE